MAAVVAGAAVGVGRAYQRVGSYCLPADAAARRYFWAHIHAPAHPRGRWWARWQPRRTEPLAWAEETEAWIAAQLGAEIAVIWRPAAPGISRAALGWVFRRGRLIALARYGEGAGAELVRRHGRGLAFVASVPGLAASTPTLLWAEEKGGRAWLLESVCAGQRLCPGGGVARRADAGLAAAWLAGFQSQTCGAGSDAVANEAWRQTLAEAIAAHASLEANVRAALLERLRVCDSPTLVAAHGDWWWGNILVNGAGAAVIDWSEFRRWEHPWHDAGFFLLTWARDATPGALRREPARWMRATLTPRAPFRRAAEAWLRRYSATAVAPAAWGEILDYLPLVMARYACFGQQATAWTAALNTWGAAGL